MVTLISLPSGILAISDLLVAQGDGAYILSFLESLGMSHETALGALDSLTAQDVDSVQGTVQILMA